MNGRGPDSLWPNVGFTPTKRIEIFATRHVSLVHIHIITSSSAITERPRCRVV